MDNRLNIPWLALRYGIGVTATLAGIDKFFNPLTDWSAYVSPIAAEFLPISTGCHEPGCRLRPSCCGRSMMLLVAWTGASSRTSARRARVNAASDITTSRTATFMGFVGVIEFAVGMVILTHPTSRMANGTSRTMPHAAARARSAHR